MPARFGLDFFGEVLQCGGIGKLDNTLFPCREVGVPKWGERAGHFIYVIGDQITTPGATEKLCLVGNRTGFKSSAVARQSRPCPLDLGNDAREGLFEAGYHLFRVGGNVEIVRPLGIGLKIVIDVLAVGPPSRLRQGLTVLSGS